MAASTDSHYNAESRELVAKIDIYFDGPGAAPFTITRDDYLVDFEVSEDFGIEDDSPLAHFTANVLDVTIVNLEGIFSPSNTASPFYGKIKQGVEIRAYIKPADEDIDWDILGKFYVMNWDVSSDYLHVNITAYDAANSIISDTEIPKMRVVQKDTLTYLQELLNGLSVHFYDTLQETPFLFPLDTKRATIDEIVNAQYKVICCDREGNVNIGTLPWSNPSRVITDHDQIVEAAIPQTFIKQYDDASLEYYIPELMTSQRVLSLSNLTLLPGLNTFNNATFDAEAVSAIEYIQVIGPSNVIALIDTAASRSVSLTLNNQNADNVLADLLIYGTMVNLTMFEHVGTGRCVKKSNRFIQTPEAAALYRNYLSTFVRADMQTISVRIRGNPKIQMGSLITVQSEKYSLDYTGIVVELKHTYNGGLSGEMVLLNIDAIGGIPQ
jgi:hypothetical protein